MPPVLLPRPSKAMIDAGMLTAKALCTAMPLAIAPSIYRENADSPHRLSDRRLLRIYTDRFTNLVEWRPRYTPRELSRRLCDEVADFLIRPN